MLYRQPGFEASGVAAFACPIAELNLDHILTSGQAFRWRRNRKGWWACVLEPDTALFEVWQDAEQVYYQVSPNKSAFRRVRDYFRLDVDLPGVQQQWRSRGGQEINDAIDNFTGLRVLRQEPVECLFSFLCSPAAPIYRIRRVLDALCRSLGAPLQQFQDEDYFAFPRIEYLAAASQNLLDRIGLGFRGVHIRNSAEMLVQRGGNAWMSSLRSATYAQAKAELMSLPGVGEKIADCVCLFSLDKDEAVPIDVHMARVARRLFPSIGDSRSLTPKQYSRCGDAFRDRFGDKAGWAQQYLYYNELVVRGLWDEELGRHRAAQTVPLKK